MSDSVVVVTGGGRGIGRAVCLRFARAGWRTVAVSRTRDDLEETGSIVAGEGGHCKAMAADITDADAVGAMMEGVVASFGGIDVLVNCAGVARVGGVESLTLKDLDAMTAVNIRGVYLTCRAAWPHMKRAGGGAIVNISSAASVDPFEGLSAYGGTKAWGNIWTKGLAEEGRPLGIHVYSVAPGAVETNMLRDAFPDFPADQTLDPMDVADMVFELCLPPCRHATGQTIRVQK